MTINAMTIAKMNGIIAIDIRSIESLDIPEATNRFKPTGGVNKPISAPITKMIPKCIGSIPNWVTTGRKSGVKIIKIESVSIKVPAISTIRPIKRRIINGLLDKFMTKFPIIDGIWYIAINLEKAAAVLRIIKIAPVIIDEEMIDFLICCKLSSLYTKIPIIKA